MLNTGKYMHVYWTTWQPGKLRKEVYSFLIIKNYILKSVLIQSTDYSRHRGLTLGSVKYIQGPWDFIKLNSINNEDSQNLNLHQSCFAYKKKNLN